MFSLVDFQDQNLRQCSIEERRKGREEIKEGKKGVEKSETLREKNKNSMSFFLHYQFFPLIFSHLFLSWLCAVSLVSKLFLPRLRLTQFNGPLNLMAHSSLHCVI